MTDGAPAATQGDVWFVQLDPTVGHEQGGTRPAVVVSVDQLGAGPSELAIVVPITKTDRPNPLWVVIEPPEGGLRVRSYAMPEMVRSISRERLVERWGRVQTVTLEEITRRVKLLMRVP